MKKILTMPAIMLMGLMACNSGSNTDTTATTDSSSTKMSTDSIHADTSHSTMSMTSMDSLPAIPEGAKVSFKNLKNGATVSSPLKVEMEATNIAIDTAGKVKPASGHFHILIDAEDSIPSGVVVAKDSTHLHFGKAQKDATLTLTPGKHKLALQFADGIHRSYGSKLSEAISVNVK